MNLLSIFVLFIASAALSVPRVLKCDFVYPSRVQVELKINNEKSISMSGNFNGRDRSVDDANRAVLSLLEVNGARKYMGNMGDYLVELRISKAFIDGRNRKGQAILTSFFEGLSPQRDFTLNCVEK